MEIFHPALVDFLVSFIEFAACATVDVGDQFAFAASRPDEVGRLVNDDVELGELTQKVLIDLLLLAVVDGRDLLDGNAAVVGRGRDLG